jgi:hypothetical protein
MKGKPYPWSIQKLSPKIPILKVKSWLNKNSLSQSFKRVLNISTVFCGVHFADKTHNLDKHTM